jgi:hypothetical protein
MVPLKGAEMSTCLEKPEQGKGIAVEMPPAPGRRARYNDSPNVIGARDES